VIGLAMLSRSEYGRVQQGRYARGTAQETLVIRHHPVLLVARAWQPGALLLTAAVLVFGLAATPSAVAGPWVLLASALFLGGGIWAAWAYLDWSNDLLYLTSHRLIEISGVVGFREERRELGLERIQSVELDQRNLLMRWYGCADLVVSVAGVGPLRFAAARDPLLVRDRILARLEERTQARTVIDEEAIRVSVEELLGLDETPLLPENAVPRPQARGTRRRAARRRPRRPPARLSFGRRFNGIAWHRHPWFLFRAWLAPLALIGLGIALPFLLDRLGVGQLFPYAGFLTLCLIIGALAWMWWRWADWRNDHYVVTPDRLIEIEQLPLGLRQQLSEAALDKVQDIRYRIPHPLASLLNYGDVVVRTASGSEPFTFRGIARPRQLAAQIDRHVTALRLAEEQARHDAVRAEFSRWLTAYDDLNPAPRRRESDQGTI
jgi:hypothetical protein